MIKHPLLSLTIVLGLLATPFLLPIQNMCRGFLPENDLEISVQSTLLEDGTVTQGLNEEQFNAVIDATEKLYAPIIADLGGKLVIQRLWTNDTVNASAMRLGDSYYVNMYGGLARHAAITEDGFNLVLCHEIGHHIGGAPKTTDWFNSWATIEGQSDYYATLKCLRRVWPVEDNLQYVAENTIDPFVEKKCTDAFPVAVVPVEEPPTEEEVPAEGETLTAIPTVVPDDILAARALCIRTAYSGSSVTALFSMSSNEPSLPEFDTPDISKVTRTDEDHPDSQCRLDTYFHGALCNKNLDEALSDTDSAQGACARENNYILGIRPLCWYTPKVSTGNGGSTNLGSL